MCVLEGRRSNNTLLKWGRATRLLWGRKGSAALGVARCLALLQLPCGDAVGRLCPPFCSTGVIFFNRVAHKRVTTHRPVVLVLLFPVYFISAMQEFGLFQLFFLFPWGTDRAAASYLIKHFLMLHAGRMQL